MIVSVASGKGGTGKTLVSTGLALSSGNCAYVDLDVEEPNGFIFLAPDIQREIEFTQPAPRIDDSVCTFCGACARACAYNALAIIPGLKKAMVFDDLCHSCGACSYVCPIPGAIREIDKATGKIRFGGTGNIACVEGRLNIGQPSGVPLIGGIVRHYLPDKELIILDSPPGTSCPVVESIKESDFVILVTEPTPFGLNDLKLAMELVHALRKEAGIVINKAQGDMSDIYNYASSQHVPVLLTIPYSLEVQRAYSKGQPLTMAMPRLRQPLAALTALISGKTRN